MTNIKADTALEILRCELAAIETYQRILESLDDNWSCEELQQLRAEHRDAVQALKKYLRCRCTDNEIESSMGDAIAEALEKTALLFDQKAALCALKEGEELNLQWYEDALNDVLLPSECQTLVRTKLLPQSETHVSILNRLLERTATG